VTFTLEKFEHDAQNKVLEDLQSYKQLYSKFQHAMACSECPENWSVDTENNRYYFLFPSMVLGGLEEFLINIRGEIFLIERASPGSDLYRFNKNYSPKRKDEPDVIEDVKQALLAYGRFGSGPHTKNGVQSLKVSPDFVGEVK